MYAQSYLVIIVEDLAGLVRAQALAIDRPCRQRVQKTVANGNNLSKSRDKCLSSMRGKSAVSFALSE